MTVESSSFGLVVGVGGIHQCKVCGNRRVKMSSNWYLASAGATTEAFFYHSDGYNARERL